MPCGAQDETVYHAFFLNHAKDLHVFILRMEELFTARPLEAVGGKNELQINTDPP